MLPAVAAPDAEVARRDSPPPEPTFAQRVPPAAPPRPHPATRRAIFFDVENTSRGEHIARVIDHLAVDRLGSATDIVAVGNWKVIGQDTARLLARHGAHLIHSAPSTGVRDWSDLRIAVAAGVWVAGARPGDVLEIISDDRAFDAVGDVAASLGIAYRRLSYRGLTGQPVTEAPVERPITAAAGDGAQRRRRRGRRGRPYSSSGRPVSSMPIRPPADAVLNGGESPAATAYVAPSSGPGPYLPEPHTAPHDEVVAVIKRLLRATSTGAVSIDAVANALREEGFRRTPGSPRLITRLRRIKELSLNRSGMITLTDAGAGREPAPPAPPREEPPRHAAEEEDLRAAERTGAGVPSARGERSDGRAAERTEVGAPSVRGERQMVERVTGGSDVDELLPGDVDGNRAQPGGDSGGARATTSQYRGARRGSRRGRGRGRGPSRAAAPVSPQS